ncbi:MAG TPA: hypothetical protein VLG72_04575 [Nitrospirota bacterium]|nr:hypothetical protein [Nitrospirota bacterium]
MALFLTLYLLYVVFREDNDMLSKTKKIMKEAVATLYLGYRITRGIDYRTLSAYILKINRYKDIDDILIENSRCLKDILDHELFGSILKNGTSLDLWIELRVHTTLFIEFLWKEFNSQIIDFNMHDLNEKTREFFIMIVTPLIRAALCPIRRWKIISFRDFISCLKEMCAVSQHDRQRDYRLHQHCAGKHPGHKSA